MKARRVGSWLQLVLGGALLLVAWVMLVWVASRPALKQLVDLTPQRVNSVDPATEELLRELRGQKAELEFHLFYEPAYGQAATAEERQEERIRDQLREWTRLLLVRYQFLAGEAVKTVLHDFYGDAPRTREAAQRFGYSGNENDVVVVALRMPGKEVRFRKLSLMLDLGQIERPNTSGPLQGQALPVLKRYVGEEQISSAIKSLLIEGTPVAYLLLEQSPLLKRGPATDGYSQFLDALVRHGFEVRAWSTAASPRVPADAALVIVLEPTSEFPERTADALFEYLQRGGRLFLNYAWSPVTGMNPSGGKLGERLGYRMSERPVQHKFYGGTRAGGRWLADDFAVTKLQLRVNSAHPVTKRIAESRRPIEVADAREVAQREGMPANIRREALLQTGEHGWLGQVSDDGQRDFSAPTVGLRPYDVGLAIEVEVDPSAAGGAATGASSRRAGVAVVIGGIFCNNLGMPLFGDLALNICNWMAERRVLLDLKDPGYEAQYLSLKPPQLERISWLLVWGVPGAFLVLGLVVLWLRRRQ